MLDTVQCLCQSMSVIQSSISYLKQFSAMYVLPPRKTRPDDVWYVPGGECGQVERKAVRSSW